MVCKHEFVSVKIKIFLMESNIVRYSKNVIPTMNFINMI